MDITNTHAQRHSEKDFAKKLSTYVDSGAGIIHVRTNEIIRAAVAIRKQAIIDKGTVKEWDIVNGFRQFNQHNVSEALIQGDGNIDIGSAFATPLETLRSPPATEGTLYFVYVAPHAYMENNPTMNQLLLTYSHCLPSSNIVIVLITPDIALPTDAESNILSLHFDPPGLSELKESLTSIVADVKEDFDEGIELGDEEIDKICYVGAGMTKNQFEMYAALAVVNAARDGKNTVTCKDVIDGVSIGKTDIVNSNDILELYPSTDINNVGGLDNLKEWVARRKNCYSDEAKDFGVEAPKGIVLVGVPGSGKSLIAKAISSELGVPLVRLDFGRVFNSLVGASEQRMRTALRMVENMSPCVLFCVDGKTQIRLSDGTSLPIEDMYNEMHKGKTYLLKGMDPETGELIDLPMRTIIRSKGKPMLRVTTESGNSIEVSRDHRLLVEREGKNVWVSASELSVGDSVIETA